MLKSISKILIVCLGLQLFAPALQFFSVGATDFSCEKISPACAATPPSMGLYLKFQQELIKLLQTKKFETATATISTGQGGLFTNEVLGSGIFKDFHQSSTAQSINIFDNSRKNSAIAFLTSIYLFEFAAMGNIVNGMSRAILFHARPIVRDWRKLLDIERSISNTAYQLGKVGYIVKTIANTEAIRQLLKKYEEKGLLNGSNNLPNNVRYLNLLARMITINAKIKAFLAFGSTSPLLTPSKLVSFKTFQITFSEEWVQTLEDHYYCVRLGTCKDFQALKEEGKNLFGSLKNHGKSAGTTIKKAIKRLSNSFTTTKLTSEEKDLLRDYGMDTSRTGLTNIKDILKLRSNLKEQWNTTVKEDIKDAGKALLDDAVAVGSFTRNDMLVKGGKATRYVLKKTGKAIGSLFSGEKNKEQEPNVTKKEENKNTPKTEFGEALKEQLISIANTIIIHNITMQATINNGDNLPVTRSFGELSDQTKLILEKIGDKDNGLRGILRDICSYQCSNKGNNGCYVN